jgi:hypothetical protein
LFAQNANSSIQGTVEDTHGAVVPNATVEVTNVGTNQTLTGTSSGDGFFTFTNLAPANYKVTVTAPGFAQWEGNLTLRVSQMAQVNPTLSAAAVSTHVTVRNVTPIIDRVNPTISDVKNATTIESMPVGGRNILAVLAFSPGVVANGYGNSGNGFTRVNGVPGGSVNYVIDGQTANNSFSGALQQNPQSTMTFQEMKILSSNGDAQYGRPGVVQLVTKSGTNQFHGQIFELNRNQHLQARGFKSGKVIPFLQHNEYGFQVGGPIFRNHTFFFFDMEWIKEQSNQKETYTVPTQSQRQGNLSDVLDSNGNPIVIYDPNTTTLSGVTYARTAFPGNIIPTSRLNPVAQKILGVTPVSGLETLPLPNIPDAQYWLSGNFNLEPPSLKAVNNEKQITAKVDQLIGTSRLAARYTYITQLNNAYHSYTPIPSTQDNSSDGGDNGSLTYTSVIGPTKVNVFHFGVQYNTHVSGPVHLLGVQTALGLPVYPGSITWPSFYFDSYNSTDDYWTGIDRNNPKTYPNQIVSIGDQFSWNPGNHQLMFGFDADNNRITTSEVGQPGGGYGYSGYFTALMDPAAAAKGSYDVPLGDTGSGLADFLLGETDGLFLNVYPVYHTRQTEFAAYAQDDWRITRKLTLNLGLRYQYWTPWTDSGGQISTFIPTVPGGMVAYFGTADTPQNVPAGVYQAYLTAGLPIESSAAAGLPSQIFSMPKNNFEPRLGFAYQLDDKTVLRGGWGIYQWIMPLNFFQQAMRKNPPYSYDLSVGPGRLADGSPTNSTAAELEFPIATANFGGPQPINQFMLGNQGCANQPAGTCNPPGIAIDFAKTFITPNSFAIVAMNPDVKPQTVQEYNLTFGRQLPWNTGLQISYIGNHYYDQLMYDPINYIIPRDLCAAANSPNVPECIAGTAQYRRPYEAFATSSVNNYNYLNYNGYGNTNEMQVQLTHTVTSNLLFQVYFTWLKALNTIGGANALGIGKLGIPQSSAIPAALTPGYSLTNPTASGASLSSRVSAVYANDPNLPAKEFKFNANYTLPFGRGQRFLGNAHGILNALVSGYNLAPFFTWHSGFYFAPYASPLATQPGSGHRGINLAPGHTGILPESQRNPNQWFDASIWDPTTGPYAGQTYEYTMTSQEGDFRNNSPFNYMTGPGFNEMDLGLYKNTPIWRSVNLNFEAQFFNVYNHINWALPSTKGIISSGVGLPRTIQLQAKVVF